MLTTTGSGSFADEMCVESGRAGRRGGGNKKQQQKAVASKQPQRGLGVAQLEKIRLHNQMMAAYRSAAAAARMPFGAAPASAAAGADPPGGVGSFVQPAYRPTSCCFEEATERGTAGAHHYDGTSLLLPYSAIPPPPTLFEHDLRDSSGQRLGQLDRQRPATPPQQHQHQHCWIKSASDDGSGAEDLDLELRL